MSTPTEQPIRRFKGVWIPASIWLNTTLTWMEKAVIAEIDSLSSNGEPCMAGDEYLANMFDVSRGRMANILSKLRKDGWVETVSFDGRCRGLRVKAEVTEPVKAQVTEPVNAEVTDSVAPNKEGSRSVPRREEREVSPSSGGKQDALPTEAKRWNEVCGTIGKVLAMSTDRLRHLKARRQDSFWVENFEAALAKIAASDFCTGKNEKGWRATFDWLVQQPGTLAKVMEGNYDNRPSGQTYRPNHSGHPRPLTGAEQRQVGIPEVNGGRSLWSIIQEREAAARAREAAENGVAEAEVQPGCESEGDAANG